MSEFDIFFDEYENKHNCSPEKYECFEAGAQSQQAKIDELQKKLDCCQEENKAHLEKIDEAWNELDDRNSKEYIIENLEKILKGNKDEN